jgi:hypothetical protein
MLNRAAFRLAMLMVAILALAACGSTASPSANAPAASAAAQASTVPVVLASPSRAASPSPSAAVAVRCDKVPMAFNATKFDLTGAWNGDDGGIYYLRQLGSILWWNGMDGRTGSPSNLGRDWNNVGRGQITGVKIQVEWADVPRGGILGGGTMSLKVADDGTGNVKIVKESETGTGFGNTLWLPCKPG